MYFIDVQGTLISDEDKSPLEGSRELLQYLNSKQIPFMIVTNNTKRASVDFIAYLQSIGLEFKKEQYIDPLMLLHEKLDVENIAAYGDELFLETLTAMGYTLDFKTPKAVVIGVKKDYNSEDFAQIIEFLLQGATLLGMHATTLYAKDGKRYAGTGAILEMLKCATGSSYEIVGKPSTAFYKEAKKMLEAQKGHSLDFESIAMMSDDVKGDLVGAKKLGMRSAFVLSGKYKTAQEIIPLLKEEQKPEYIVKNLLEVLELIKGERL